MRVLRAAKNGKASTEFDHSRRVVPWIRRFDSDEQRDQLYQAVYESDYWKNEVAPKIPAMLDRNKIVVTRIESTPKSVIH